MLYFVLPSLFYFNLSASFSRIPRSGGGGHYGNMSVQLAAISISGKNDKF